MAAKYGPAGFHWYDPRHTRPDGSSPGPIVAPREWAKEDPAYYHAEGQSYDVIDVIAAFKLDFDLGCVVKYVLRAGKKPGNDFLTDLRKAKRVLERRIEREEKAATAR